MKKLFLTLVCLLILNCSASKTDKPIKIKTFETGKLTVKHPKTWIKIGAMGSVFFMPKKLRKVNNQFNEVEHVSTNKHFIQIQSNDDIESLIYNHGNKLSKSEKTKSFKLIKLETGAKFNYKLESIITYKTIPGIYKNEAFFIIKDNQLEYFYYQMRESLFDQYHDDAMLIINSIKEKN